MKISTLLIATLTAILSSTTHAQLPVLKDKDWTGYYTGTKNRKAFFGITQNTDSVFHVLDKEGEILRSGNPVKISFRVLEVDPDGKFIRKTLDKTSLSSNAEAKANYKIPLTFKGMVNGNATFQTSVNLIPVGFTASGKITSPGDIKNPVIFGIGIDFDPYQGVDLNDKKNRREIDKFLRRDKLEITALDGVQKRYKMDAEVDFATVFPDGVSSIALQCHRYENVEYVITASKGSAIHFTEDGKTPVYKALKLFWKVNDRADPAGENLTMVAK